MGLGRVQPKWGTARFCRILTDFAGFCRILTDFGSAGFCRILTDFDGFGRILTDLAGSCRILTDFAGFCRDGRLRARLCANMTFPGCTHFRCVPSPALSISTPNSGMHQTWLKRDLTNPPVLHVLGVFENNKENFSKTSRIFDFAHLESS